MLFDQLTPEQKKEAQSLWYHGMFSDRESVGEALEYATSLIEALPKEDRAAAYTAVYVVLNTAIVNHMVGKLEEGPDCFVKNNAPTSDSLSVRIGDWSVAISRSVETKEVHVDVVDHEEGSTVSYILGTEEETQRC